MSVPPAVWLFLSEFDREDAEAGRRHERRVANGTAAKPRPRCSCRAYPFPHRPRGGLCRYPEPPLAKLGAEPSRHAPVGMRRRSSIRRRLLHRYCLHPIRDRALIRRWLPKLYTAYCRRHGYTYPEDWMGGYVPAMLITADGPRAANAAPPRPFPSGYAFGSWREAIWRDRRIKPLRNVERRRNRKN